MYIVYRAEYVTILAITQSLTSIMTKCFKIFVLSDQPIHTPELAALLEEYQDYELHYIPTDLGLFDVYNLEPDIVVLDKYLKKVVNCYEWGEVA